MNVVFPDHTHLLFGYSGAVENTTNGFARVGAFKNKGRAKKNK